MAINISNSMLLPIPQVGSEQGPDYAFDVNNCLTIIDTHDHASGSGIQINPAGLDINTDLSFGSNNAINLRSVRLDVQGAPLAGATDLNILYDAAGDLYFNDALGNQIQLTANGSIAGTSGSIANLVSPASASYVSASNTFVWQSAANTAANMDFRNAILRNATASSSGLTLSPPAGMVSDYQITLPALPVSTMFLNLSSSGTMSTWGYDNATVTIAANTLKVKDGGINTTQLTDAGVTRPKLSALGQQLSSSSGSFTTSSTSFVAVTGLSVAITTTGRPVSLSLQSDGSGSPASAFSTGDGNRLIGRILRGGVEIAQYVLAGGAGLTENQVSASAQFMDVVAAGTYTYTVEIKAVTSENVALLNYKLLAFEM